MSTTRWRQDPLADNHFKFTEEGVEIRKYISSKKFRKLEWNKLTNIIVWGKYGGLGIIDNNGKLLWGFVYKHGFFNSRKKIEPIWQKWLRGIRNKDKINTFKCSPQINIKEKWEYIYDIFGFLGIGIILSILLVGLIIKNEWQFEADDYMFWIVVPLLNAFFYVWVHIS